MVGAKEHNVSQPGSTFTQTLGATLEWDRLERRAGRMTVAVAALRKLAGKHRHELGGAPVHIRKTIADFEAQLAVLDARLRALAADPPPTHGRRIEWLG